MLKLVVEFLQFSAPLCCDWKKNKIVPIVIGYEILGGTGLIVFSCHFCSIRSNNRWEIKKSHFCIMTMLRKKDYKLEAFLKK